MLQGISWTDYGTGIAILLFFYYAWVVLVHYRQDIAGLRNNRKDNTPGIDPATENKNEKPATGAVIRKL